MIRNLETAIVAEGSEIYPRCSEGSMLELKNGELFMIFQRYEKSALGSEDGAPNTLVSMRSSDGGRTWGRLRTEVLPDPGDVNVYSPNLIRLPDGSILFIYMRYLQYILRGETYVTAKVRRSTDECETFSEYSVMWERQHFCFPSATIRLLSDGRLILPVEYTDATSKEITCCAISDDCGITWHVPEARIKLPMRGAMEGHIEEPRDGRLIMVMRTQLGAIFKSYSADRGETWSKPQTTGMRSPEACPEIMRVPSSGKLMLVWNNSEYDPSFRSHYGKRSPLSVALSYDEGETFRFAGDVETDPEWGYSNPGVYFLKSGKCVMNYWATKYTPDWVMSGHIHLKTAIFDI